MIRNEEAGSFSLESVFVFPILFLLVLLMMFMGLFAYQNVIMTYAAAITAERAAFGWDNSRREPRTGMLSEAAYDGLYAGLGADGAIGSLFGLAAGAEAATVSLPAGDAGEEGTLLAERKLEQASGWLAKAGLNYAGEISRANEGLLRFVRVRLDKPVGSMLMRPWGGGGFVDPSGSGKAIITEPVAFMRNVDLARYYAAKFANATAGGKTAKKQAGDVLSSYGGNQPR
ncbi:MAG: hypothetical protein K0Q63_2561 [Paenibacillus sp.]|nr:hypothetical protein [Paenibacillus sp.]